MTDLKQQMEKLLEQQFAGHIQFLQLSVGTFVDSLQDLKKQSRALNAVLAQIQSEPQPLKSMAQDLANFLRDYIFAALTWCTGHDRFIPVPSVQFQHLFSRSTLLEFFSREASLSSEIHANFARATKSCLSMAARYQSVRPQSLKSNKQLLDMITFPHFCEIEEDVHDLNELLGVAKSLVDDLYMWYFKLMEFSPVFATDTEDPILELQIIADAMKEQLADCERLFVKKTSLFKKLYEKLSAIEKEEFARRLSKDKDDNEEEQGNEQEDETEEDDEDDSYGIGDEDLGALI
jgi:hypothetical protein